MVSETQTFLQIFSALNIEKRFKTQMERSILVGCLRKKNTETIQFLVSACKENSLDNFNKR